MMNPDDGIFDFDRAASETYTWAEILGGAGFKVVHSDESDPHGVIRHLESHDGSTKVAYRSESERLLIGPKARPMTKRQVIAELYFDGNRFDCNEFILSGTPLESTSLRQLGRRLREDADEIFENLDNEDRYSNDAIFAARVDARKAQLNVESEAKRRFQEASQNLPSVVPESFDLQDLLDSEDQPADYLIDGLLERVSTATIVASAKVGKTTFIYNLIRSLVDNEPFLGKFPTHDVRGKVGFVNFELSDSQAKRWFLDMPIVNRKDTVRIWNLRGKTNPFMNEQRRQEFINEVRAQNIKVMILDPFSSAARGHNTLDNDDVKDFFLALEEFKEAAGVECLLVAVHAGHNAERARGASTLADHPDAIMTLELKPRGMRTFRARGRDVDVEEGALAFDPSTRSLTYREGELHESKSEWLQTEILDFIMKNPGCSSGELEIGVSGAKTLKAKARNSLKTKGLIRVELGDKGRIAHYPVIPGAGPSGTTVPGAAGGGSPLYIGGPTSTTGPSGPSVISYMRPLGPSRCIQQRSRRPRVGG